jgi:cell wall assembly regulator SMI1
MVSVRDSWLLFEQWFSNSLPDELLPSGANDVAIQQVEETIGLRFPKALRDLYRIHDGTHGIWISKGGYLRASGQNPERGA